MTRMCTIMKFIALLTIIQAVICTTKPGVAPDAKEFFAKTIDGNLTKVTWVHAVNSKEMLQNALKNDKVMMLEADVILGNLDNSTENGTQIPIMAHSAGDTSDLSLEEFLNTVVGDGKRGIKLDFKSIEAFNGSRKILEKLRANITVPLWLNADILPGPVDADPTDPKPVDPASFISGAGEFFPESTLSLGWTTKYGSKMDITSGNYTQDQIHKMIDTIGQSKTKQSITYPIRAGLAANGVEIFKNLLKDTAVHKPTLTIWSSANDTVDHVALSKFIKEIGVDKVYVDVPEDLWAKLQISGARSLATSSVMLVGSLLTSIAITKFM